jgi:hypothetical protein
MPIGYKRKKGRKGKKEELSVSAAAAAAQAAAAVPAKIHGKTKRKKITTVKIGLVYTFRRTKYSSLEPREMLFSV